MTPSRRVWTMPILLGVVTLAGLVVGLLEDGVWDLVATAALALPVLVGAWHMVKPARAPH